jgi:ammonium transporter Rh
LATFEIIFYGLNEAICAGLFMAVDMGGSMYVHTFGAYFGLSASYFFSTKAVKEMEELAKKDHSKNKAEGGYTSQYVAMVGTLFLWMYWPSFNGALAIAHQQ